MYIAFLMDPYWISDAFVFNFFCFGNLKFRLSPAERVFWSTPPKSCPDAHILVTVDNPGLSSGQSLTFFAWPVLIPGDRSLANLARRQK